MSFFDLKSMSILMCRHFVTFIAVCFFVHKCVFTYIIHIVDLSFIYIYI